MEFECNVDSNHLTIGDNDVQETKWGLTLYEGRILWRHVVVEREANRTIECSSCVNHSFEETAGLTQFGALLT